jgi:segregation and condensation protein B
MSLKAKLEAVIYAAEEPVSLAQLAMIFAGEAFEWKAEQDAARAQEAAQGAETAAPLPLEMDAGVAPAEGVASDGESAAVAAESADETGGQPTDQAAGPGADALEPTTEVAAEAIPGEVAEPDAAAAEAEMKRAARQRDRDARAILRQLMDEIIAAYEHDDRGVEIREIAGGYRMATKPECHDAVRMFVKSLKPPLKLSLPALETLAVIAYKQPVTAPEVNEVRGVDSSGVFGSLLARKLVATAGRKQVIGRPILYKTTKEFLLRFGLKDLSELPSMEEFEKMAASELEEIEPAEAADAETAGAGGAAEFDGTAAEPETVAAENAELDGEKPAQESAESDETAEAPEPKGESNSSEAAQASAE